MTKNLEKIFLGILWLMTVTLATTFWMNTKYGFNIFSTAHWAYLSNLQANNSQIKPGFYVSLLVFLLVAVIGLFLMAHPHLRKIKIFGLFGSKQQNTKQSTAETFAPKKVLFGLVRPHSPLQFEVKRETQHNVPTATTTATPLPSGGTPAPAAPGPTPGIPEEIATQMREILSSNDYQVFACSQIDKLVTPVVALDYSQNMWIAYTDTDAKTMMDAIGSVMTVFEQTLGDSANEILVHGCIINADPTVENPNAELISTFENIDQFKEFFTTHKNIKPEDFDENLYAAISTYIKTVASQIGKMKI